jgi:hypothetical protein
MEIEDTAVYKEIVDVISEGPKPISYYYKAIIHTEKGDYEVTKLIDSQINRDYVAAAGDDYRLTVLIPLGMWAIDIFPYIKELEISIIKKPLIEIGDHEDEEEEIETKRYIATADPDKMPVITGRDMAKLSKSELDIRDIFEVEFQLHEKVLYSLRLRTYSGTFRRTTAESFIKYALASESVKIKADEDSTCKGVDVVKTDNKEPREHIVVPNGVNVVDLPMYVHRNAGGVYSTGLGSYYQNRYWFVYPLWNTQRFDEASKTLVIVKVPVFRFTGIERTYREEGDSVYVLATSNSEISDDAYTNFSNMGNGSRFADSRLFVRDFSEVKDNKSISRRGDNNHEFLSVDRGEERNTVYFSRQRISANPYVERSGLASRKGCTYLFNWENSSPDLLIPGMMCKIYYMEEDSLMELAGVLIANSSNIQMTGVGLTTKRHVTTTTLLIFANPSESEVVESEEIDEEDWTDYEAI